MNDEFICKLNRAIAPENLTKYSLIECFGSPGVGKTYQATNLINNISECGLNDCNNLDIEKSNRFVRVIKKLYFIFRYIIFNRNLCLTLNSLLKLYSPLGCNYYVKLLFNWYYICGYIIHKLKKSDVIIMDQAISQALWSCAYYGNENINYDLLRIKINKLLNHISIDSILIINITANNSIINSRIFNRKNGMSPLDNADFSSIQKGHKITSEMHKILDKLVIDIPAIDIVTVEN